jgi:uncharacterized surface protein with fasciclin (FAS1) repeats
MKRKLQLIALTFVATFLFTNLSFAQFVLQKTNGSAAPTEKEDEGQWIHYDSGESTNAIGLNGGGLFEVAARWEPAELEAFDGYAITKMRMYINNVPTSLTARIWQGADAASLDVMLSQFFEGAEESWVEIELQEPYMIDTSLELWIGYQVDDPGAGNFSAGIDGEADFVGFGNKVRLGTDAWTDLSSFGIAGNWNVQAFVVEMDEPYTVVDIIVGSEDHTTLATAVTLAGLVDALSGEGPFTVFAPTDAAFDALPDGLLDALIADPEGDLTKVLLYHVVAGNVLSGDLSDGQVITTLLGQELTVTIDGGVFINDVGGNSVQVTVPDLEADNGVVHVVDGVLIPDLTVSTYSVTFNVDMNDVEGFDPDVHDVYIAGSFPGDLEWNEPGSNDDLKLTLVGPAKNDPVVIWEEGFEPAVASGALPDGWTQKKADNAVGNNLQDLASGDTQWWRYSEQYYLYDTFYPEWIRTGEASLHINWNVQDEQNVYAISPEFTLPEAEMMMLEFWKYFPSSYETEINVLLELDGTWEVIGEYNSATAENLYTSAVEIDLTGKVGAARIAFVYKWTDGIQMNIDDVVVYGTPSGTTDDYIYTITLDVEEGEVQYKYFSTVIDTGWAGGEWAGDPNRVIDVEGDMVQNDVFGEQPVSVVENELAEQGINLFPNPVRNTLFVENSELINDLRIFDLTGRMVFSQVVNDNTTSINVSMFKTGVYIMQVMTVNGVVSKKFSVQ